MLPGTGLNFSCNTQTLRSQFGKNDKNSWIQPVTYHNDVGETSGPSEQTEHSLNGGAYLSIVAEHVLPFMETLYPSSDGYLQQDNTQSHKALFSNWLQEDDN